MYVAVFPDAVMLDVVPGEVRLQWQLADHLKSSHVGAKNSMKKIRMLVSQ